MRQRYAGVLAALLAVAAALTACDDTEKKSGSEGYTIGPGDQYVALGDSYTAATNTGPGDVSDGCGRSLTNYPHLIAAATGAHLVDNSCNGASTSHVTQAQTTSLGEHPPQLTSVDEDTDLVTMRLGANDYLLLTRIFKCALQYGGQSGSPCSDLDASAGPDSLDARLPEVEENVSRAINEIQDRAPHAEIIIVGYPRLAPDSGTCDLLPAPEDDYVYARRVVDGLNQALRSAAAEAELTYIDVAAASDGHDICSDEPWVAGDEVVGGGAIPWHPYPAESQAIAELVLRELE